MACSFTSSTTVNEVYDERFEEIYRPNDEAIELLDNGRTCSTARPGLGSHGCALGHHSYSSGIHRIRLRLVYGIAFLGIRSRNIPPVSDELAADRYDNSPSSYGWATSGYRISNGNNGGAGFQVAKDCPTGFVLILNCDERSLSIVNENNNGRDKMEVDILHAPFPWCLFVQVSRTTGRVSLVHPPTLTFKLTSANTTLIPTPAIKTLGILRADHQIIENDTKNTNTISTQFTSALQLWRQEAYQMIDQYCEKKRKEFVELLDQQQLDRTRLPSPINETSNLQSIFSSLTFDDDLIHFRSNKLVSKKILPFQTPGRTGLLEENHGCIAANDNHYVIIQANNLCLYNLQRPMKRAFQWTYGDIYDMFWCHALDQFIFIVEHNVLLFNDKTMTLCPLSLSDNQNSIDFYGGRCVGNVLFLFTWGWGPSIYVYVLRPVLELKRKYEPPFPYTTDELVLHCASNYQALAMVIKNERDEIRLDLCSPINMERFWSVKLDLTAGYRNIRCCSVNNNDWMVISPDSSTLLHISAEGELVEKDAHNPVPWYGISLSDNDVLILSDSEMKVYRLS